MAIDALAIEKKLRGAACHLGKPDLGVALWFGAALDRGVKDARLGDEQIAIVRFDEIARGLGVASMGGGPRTFRLKL